MAKCYTSLTSFQWFWMWALTIFVWKDDNTFTYKQKIWNLANFSNWRWLTPSVDLQWQENESINIIFSSFSNSKIYYLTKHHNRAHLNVGLPKSFRTSHQVVYSFWLHIFFTEILYTCITPCGFCQKCQLKDHLLYCITIWFSVILW